MYVFHENKKKRSLPRKFRVKILYLYSFGEKNGGNNMHYVDDLLFYSNKFKKRT